METSIENLVKNYANDPWHRMKMNILDAELDMQLIEGQLEMRRIVLEEELKRVNTLIETLKKGQN